ncbi:unnamed protein product [Anisakis simplex]|uniref:Uncharacterized protein n=1 Tax=Anisakis simplex TaxID=6269 RepID=A0A0M3JPX4_ANISI|nr:unnamed protein product [Anisakis simplex]
MNCLGEHDRVSKLLSTTVDRNSGSVGRNEVLERIELSCLLFLESLVKARTRRDHVAFKLPQLVSFENF